MDVVAAAVVPHAPLLVPGVAGARDDDALARVRATAVEVFPRAADAVVVLSPHGRAAGVYRRVRGSLDGFGLAGCAVDVPTDDALARALAESWGRPLLDGPCDHGVVVPLALARPAIPVVAAALPECTGPGAGPVRDALDEGARVAAALRAVTAEARVAFVASAHTAASLTPRAPLTERREGRKLDDVVIAALAGDATRLGALDERAWSDAGACGGGPLRAFASLASGMRAEVRAYDAPLGVGYVVAAALP